MVHGVQTDPLNLITKINALFNKPKENNAPIAVN